MREKKYIEFLKDIDVFNGKEKYYKHVKYRIDDETCDEYMLSKKKNIAVSKSKEGDLYIIGKI